MRQPMNIGAAPSLIQAVCDQSRPKPRSQPSLVSFVKWGGDPLFGGSPLPSASNLIEAFSPAGHPSSTAGLQPRSRRREPKSHPAPSERRESAPYLLNSSSGPQGGGLP